MAEAELAALMGVNRPAAEIVAVVLAAASSTALFLLTTAAVWGLITAGDLDAARLVAVTQVLTGWGGGILGVLGAYIGYSFGAKKHDV